MSMGMEEFNDILAWLGDKTNIERLDAEDQLSLMLAMTKMAETMKPIYLKYKVQSREKFIMRL